MPSHGFAQGTFEIVDNRCFRARHRFARQLRFVSRQAIGSRDRHEEFEFANSLERSGGE